MTHHPSNKICQAEDFCQAFVLQFSLKLWMLYIQNKNYSFSGLNMLKDEAFLLLALVWSACVALFDLYGQQKKD